MRLVLAASLRYGWRRAAVRWVMLGAFAAAGVGYYVAFAVKPYLLQLAGDENAYGLLGVAAALNAAAQMLGGLLATGFGGLFRRRMSLVIAGVVAGTALLLSFGEGTDAPSTMALLAAYSLVTAATLPARQAYLNSLVPTRQRATVLSFDSLVGAGGGVAVQPVLGRAADAWGYAGSYQLGGALQLLGVPLLMLALRHETEPAGEPFEAAAGS